MPSLRAILIASLLATAFATGHSVADAVESIPTGIGTPSLENAGKSCTTAESGVCAFRCNPGDVISVSATTDSSFRKTAAYASCGGVSTSCEGHPTCNGESDEQTAAGAGKCHGDDDLGSYQTFSCSAHGSPAEVSPSAAAGIVHPAPKTRLEDTMM